MSATNPVHPEDTSTKILIRQIVELYMFGDVPNKYLSRTDIRPADNMFIVLVKALVPFLVITLVLLVLRRRCLLPWEEPDFHWITVTIYTIFCFLVVMSTFPLLLETVYRLETPGEHIDRVDMILLSVSWSVVGFMFLIWK